MIPIRFLYFGEFLVNKFIKKGLKEKRKKIIETYLFLINDDLQVNLPFI